MAGAATTRVPPSRVLLVASFGAFLAFLDATIVNVAFPSIRESFAGTTISELSWVLNAYNIVFAASLILCGRLTDLVGRRRSFVAGVAVFTIASGLCGIAPSVELLVLARVVQAFGAAMLVPASLALVIAAFPAERRAHAIGVWGATAAVAAGVGPPIGGALVELGGWRWAFLVNLPFGLVAVWAARHELVESRAPGRRTVPDLVGAVLLVVSLALLNLGIVKGSDWGWASPAVLGSFAGAVLAFGLFVVSSRRHRAPMLDPMLLRLPSFRWGSVATIAAGFGFYAYLLTNVLWLQYVWGYDVLRAGLALVPGAVVAALVASRLGPLADRHGYRAFVVPGALVWAAAYVWYHQRVGLQPAFWAEWMPGQVLSGIGVGATLPLLGSAALAAVPGGRYATASAVVSSARQLGGVLGIALLVVVLGEPTPATAVASFRQGWVLSIVAFLVVAVVAAPLGRLRSAPEDEAVADERPAVVHPPDAPAEWAVPAAGAGDLTDLSELPMFAVLPAQARERLELATRPVELPAGTVLVAVGDPPGSAYVVRTGRLEVLVDGAVVRELGPGQVLGELALLSGEPRSATVRARRDTTLTEIPRDAFEDVLTTDPVAARFVLGQVADRLRTAGGPAAAPPPERVGVVAVVGLGDGVRPADVGQVAAALRTRLASHLSVAVPGVVGRDGLARAERENDRVLLVAGSSPDDGDAGWRDFCVRQADAVVLVARSGDPVPTASPSPAPARRPELVLLGPAPTPEQRVAWVAATDAWQLTCVPGDPATGVRPVADRLAGRSLGLVLAGGGARAFAHIGVLRELEDAGLHVDRVAGSSVGAIIAALHATGVDGATLEEIVLRGVRPTSPVQRLPPVGPVPRPGQPGSRRALARLRRRHRARGPASAVRRRQRGPREQEPPGPPARRARGRRAGVVPVAGAVRAGGARRRSAARRRRRPRQHAHRPARAAGRGTRRGREHRVRRRGPCSCRSPAGPRARRHPDAHDDDRQRRGRRGGDLTRCVGRQPVVEGGGPAGVPPDGPDGGVRSRRRADPARAGGRGPPVVPDGGPAARPAPAPELPEAAPPTDGPGRQEPNGQPSTMPGVRPGSM